MNLKYLIIGIIVLAGLVFAVIFADQFAKNQTELSNEPLDFTPVSNGEKISDEETLIPETTEGLPTSTETSDIESDLDDIDLSGLDDGLNDLNNEAEGL